MLLRPTNWEGHRGVRLFPQRGTGQTPSLTVESRADCSGVQLLTLKKDNELSSPTPSPGSAPLSEGAGGRDAPRGGVPKGLESPVPKVSCHHSLRLSTREGSLFFAIRKAHRCPPLSGIQSHNTSPSAWPRAKAPRVACGALGWHTATHLAGLGSVILRPTQKENPTKSWL